MPEPPWTSCFGQYLGDSYFGKLKSSSSGRLMQAPRIRGPRTWSSTSETRSSRSLRDTVGLPPLDRFQHPLGEFVTKFLDRAVLLAAPAGLQDGVDGVETVSGSM